MVSPTSFTIPTDGAVLRINATVLTLCTLVLVMLALVAVVAVTSLITRLIEALVSPGTQLPALYNGADTCINVVIVCPVGSLLVRIFSVLLHTLQGARRK